MPDKEPPCGLGRECFHIHDEFLSVPLSLLERLAPSLGIASRCPCCLAFALMCPGDIAHEDGCCWVEARKLIEEAKGG